MSPTVYCRYSVHPLLTKQSKRMMLIRPQWGLLWTILTKMISLSQKLGASRLGVTDPFKAYISDDKLLS